MPETIKNHMLCSLIDSYSQSKLKKVILEPLDTESNSPMASGKVKSPVQGKS